MEFIKKNPNFLFILLIINLVYFPSCFFGYFTDDYQLVPKTFVEATSANFEHHFRPLWYYSYPFVNLISDGAFLHHFANLILFNIVIFFFFLLAKRCSISWIILLAIFTHPVFIWPVTWIAQRNDLLLLTFLSLALVYENSRWCGLFVVLSNLSKSPFLFQNVYFAKRFVKRKEYYSAILVVGVMFLMIYLGVKFTLPSAKVSNFALIEKDLIGLGLVGLGRVAKIFEGLFYIFVPFPAFWNSRYFVGLFSLYCLLWIVILSFCILQRRDVRNFFRFLGLALLMAVPLSFDSEMRVVGPVLVFAVFSVGMLLYDGRVSRILFSVLIIFNFFAMYPSYLLSDSKCYELDAAYDQCFQQSHIPYYQYKEQRKEIVKKLYTIWFQ